jgi:uncharacterized membrane protein (UPF0127 family)
MKLLLTLLAFLTAAPIANAETEQPLLFSRSQITVVRKQPPVTAAEFPWQSDTAETAGLVFNIELRDGTTLFNQEGWYSLSSPAERSGTLMVFPTPQIVPIVASTQYAPLDILFIDKEGMIVQIAPSLVLSTLEEDIYPPRPVLAMLFVKGGTCERLSIRPGDEIEYELFKKPPPVLTSPAPETPASPPPAEKPAAVQPQTQKAAPVQDIRILSLPKRK